MLDYRKGLTSDTTLVLVIKNDPDCYIGEDDAVKLRLQWDETLGTNTGDWTASIDQLRIEEIGT